MALLIHISAQHAELSLSLSNPPTIDVPMYLGIEAFLLLRCKAYGPTTHPPIDLSKLFCYDVVSLIRYVHTHYRLHCCYLIGGKFVSKCLKCKDPRRFGISPGRRTIHMLPMSNAI